MTKMLLKTERIKALRGLIAVLTLLVSVLALTSCSLIPESLLPREQTESYSPLQEYQIPVTRGTIKSSLSFDPISPS